MSEPLTEEGLWRVLAKVFRAAADALSGEAEVEVRLPASNSVLPETPVPDLGAGPVLTVEDVAAVLGIGRTSAYELCRRGELPTVRLGRRILIPTHRLRAYLDGMST